MIRLTARACICFLAVLATPDRAVSQACAAREVSRGEVVAAMREHGNYDIVATTNWGRFQAEVFFRLIRSSRADDPASGVIVVSAEDWYRGYLEVAGLTDATAPDGVRLSYEVRQMMLIDFRPDHVVRAVRKGPTPQMAANVRISWPAGPGVPEKYGYHDTLSVPRLKVTSHRVITYRLLDFGNMVLYDDLTGVSGRPTSGILGALFALIGDGALIESRLAIAADDLLVVVARSRKIFTKTVTVTVQRGGSGEKGIPDGRPDLAALERRLRQPLVFEYAAYSCSSALAPRLPA